MELELVPLIYSDKDNQDDGFTILFNVINL